MTSFFNNSIHQLVAVEQHCKFSMMNGRENRNNGNQEKGKEEKETLSKVSTSHKGTRNASPKFLCEGFKVSRFQGAEVSRFQSSSVRSAKPEPRDADYE